MNGYVLLTASQAAPAEGVPVQRGVGVALVFDGPGWQSGAEGVWLSTSVMQTIHQS